MKIGFILPLDKDGDKQIRLDCLLTISGFLCCLKNHPADGLIDCIYEDELPFAPNKKDVAAVVDDLRRRNVSAIVTFGDEIGKITNELLIQSGDNDSLWKVPVLNIAYSLEYNDNPNLVAIRLWPSARLLSCFIVQATKLMRERKVICKEDILPANQKEQSLYTDRYRDSLLSAGYVEFANDKSNASTLSALVGYGADFYEKLELGLKEDKKIIVTENFLHHEDISEGVCIYPGVHPIGQVLNVRSFDCANEPFENHFSDLLAQFFSIKNWENDVKFDQLLNEETERYGVKWPSPICKYLGYASCEMLLRAKDALVSLDSASLWEYFKKSRYFTTILGPVIVEHPGETAFPISLNVYESGSEREEILPEMQRQYEAGYLLEKADEIFPEITSTSVSEKFDDGKFLGYVGNILHEIKDFSGYESATLLAGINKDDFMPVYPKGEQGELIGAVIHFMKQLPTASFEEVIQLDSNGGDFENNDTLRLYSNKDKTIVTPTMDGITGVDRLCFAKNLEQVKWRRHRIDLAKQAVSAYKKIPFFDGYVYIIPALGSSRDYKVSKNASVLILHCKDKLPYLAIHVLLSIVTRLFAQIFALLYAAKLQVANTKSAIGSIMSRNGSHNIGSHVLAALSHNVGTMPDDRVLYQYIQHRMDYIATATTEFPTWRQPMLFVSSVMKQFMMQKHLLNFISRSEGLQAYQFQNPALTASTQPNTIRLHVRRIHDEIKDWEGRGKYSESEYDNFIPYGNEKAGSFERDILVAIPGGVIGQHAFYTIIENILRNAAKHEWATAKIKNDHLDVYIDFHDNPNEGVVEFQVWNDRVNKDKETSDDRNISSLVKTLAERMSASFIDNEGGLRKENWGLAEMRISAGFLRGSDVSIVGGIGVGQKEMLGLIRPLVVGNGEGKECLGYRFDLHKPRELLVVLPNKYCEGKGAKFTADKIISLNKMLSQYGVNVMPESEAGKSKGLAYSYVLFDNFDGKVQGRYNLPFRVLSAGDAINLSNEGRRVRVVAKFNGDFIKDVRNELECLPEHDQGDTIRTFAHKILEQIYSSWIVHVRSQRSDIGKDPALVIDIKDDGGGGKSLFANANLLYFIFESSFNSAVRSYLAMHTPESLTPSLAGALYAFTELSPRPQFSAKELAEEVDDDADVGNMILAQLVKWGDLAKEDMRVCKGYTTAGLDGMILPLQDEWNGAEIWQKEFAKWSPRVGIELLLNGLLGYDSDACAKMHDFINYLSGPILEQARAYLAKYEERYATLPEGFGIQNGADKNDDAKLKLGIDNSVQSISFTSDDVKKSKLKKQAFCYWRHGDKDVSDNNACNKINEKATYLEPLSGAQSYLNAFRELCSNLCYIKNGKGQIIRDAQLATKRNDAIRFVAELVENSVMRVLIIDERTKKFADEHPDVAAIFASTGISVLGGGEEVVAGIFRSFSANPKIANNKGFAKKIIGTPISDFEILIVHQGIIDKQLHGSGKEAMIKVFYEWLKKYMRYVVITTGRGTPPNVPSDARVLPFSIIENTLFKRYPEKMLLVDTVMNMLPIGERGAQ